jgi:hypothetical protein
MIKRALGVTLISSVTLQGCSVEEERRGRIMANAVAIREAQKIQDEISRTLKCPSELAGWSSDQRALSRLVTHAGTQEAQFLLRYECFDDGLEFYITVVYSFDSESSVSGSTKGPLEVTYGHFTAPHTLTVSRSDDADAVAARVVRGGT